MQQNKETIDSVSVMRATDTAIHYGEDTVKRALGYLRDDKKKERLEKGECKFCFYIRTERIGGSAMTQRPCGICSTMKMYGSTNTDKICLDCATKHKLCKYCGADALLRPRRIFEAT